MFQSLFSFFVMVCSVGVFAQQSQKVKTIVTHDRASIRLNDLRCVIQLGVDLPLEQRTTLQLGSREKDALSLTLNPLSDEQAKHTFATAPTCDHIEADRLAKESVMFFGFQHDTPITLTKHISEPFKNGFGQCIQNIHEILEIQLSSKITLTSEEYLLHASEGCSK